ncbi:MAG: hypothetical protein J5685_02705 [Clostridiales bacterium]|nr:hypothetical protein [Clostridiales bacterium]
MTTRDRKDIIRRYLQFIVGLFVASMGVALSTKAGLGTSPVASVPYSVSLVCKLLTFGWWLNILSLLQIFTQILVMKFRCNYVEILIQGVLAFIYGYMTDLSCYLIRGITAETYVVKFVFMLLGCVVLALGIWIQFKGGVAMLPGEAMNRAISKVTGKKYENVKIFFDLFYIVTAASVCLLFLGKLEGVREGSIIAAFLVGTLIKGYNRLFDKVTHKKQAA